MTTNTTLLLLLSLLIAGRFVVFSIFLQSQNQVESELGFGFFRFLSIFGILLLLINPIMSRKTLETIKTPLPIVVDNSSSIADLNAKEMTLELYKKLFQNERAAREIRCSIVSIRQRFSTIARI